MCCVGTKQLRPDLDDQPRMLRYSRRRLSISTHCRDSGKVWVWGVFGKGWSASAAAARSNQLHDVRLPSRLLARVHQRRAMLSSGPRVGACRPHQSQVLEQREQPQTGVPPHPCPLQPASLTLIPPLPACAVVSHAFARLAVRYDRASWSPRTPCTLSGAARAPLQHHLRVDAPYRPRAAVIACGVRSGRVCMSSPGCTAGTVFTHVEPEMRMYMIV